MSKKILGILFLLFLTIIVTGCDFFSITTISSTSVSTTTTTLPVTTTTTTLPVTTTTTTLPVTTTTLPVTTTTTTATSIATTTTTTTTQTQYTLHFISNGGSEVADIVLAFGSPVTSPIPTKAGYIFSAWYTEVELINTYVFGSMPAENLTLYAKWTPLIVEDDPSDYSFFLKQNGTYEVTGYIGTNTEIVIPSSYLGIAVTSIGDAAFYVSSTLTSVVIPSSVTVIGNQAFYQCFNLTYIAIPSGVYSIGTHAFFHCMSLTDIILPSGLLYIGFYAFAECTGLTSITIPNNVVSINYNAFDNCINLERIVIPSSVTYMGYLMFSGCTKLTIYAEAANQPIGWDENWNYPSRTVYWDYSETKTITFETSGGSVVESITQDFGSIGTQPENPVKEGYNFDGWYLDEELTVSYSYSNALIANITLYAKWMELSIGDDPSDYTFLLLANETYEVTGYIGASTELVLPNLYLGKAVTSIGAFAFSNCFSITSITIPSSVTSIADWVFRDCSSLTSIIVDDASNWFSSENGVLFNKQKTILITYLAGKIETTYQIPSSVTNIGYLAFSDCINLTSVTFESGSQVSSIDSGAFRGCSGLLSITIPSSVTSIGGDAFYNCISLTSIIVDAANNWYSSEDGVLFNKQKTELITYLAGKTETTYQIPFSVTIIGSYAFYNCINLTSVTIPEGVASISDGAFYNCSNLTIVTIPSSLNSIGGGAFHGCSSLSSITIPSSVTSIEHDTFYNCSSLMSITIPSSVTSIGAFAFYNCSSLTIYAEVASQPLGWDTSWNPDPCPVIWGYVG